jgi:hypothetical protein
MQKFVTLSGIKNQIPPLFLLVSDFYRAYLLNDTLVEAEPWVYNNFCENFVPIAH